MPKGNEEVGRAVASVVATNAKGDRVVIEKSIGVIFTFQPKFKTLTHI